MSAAKILLTADWQLCNSLPHAKAVEHGETDRLLDQKAVINRIMEIAVEEEVMAMIVLGDLFERRLLDAVTLRFGVEALLHIATIAPLYVLPGNHDAHSLSGERFTPEFLDELNSRITFLYEGVYEIPGCHARFFALPWCSTKTAVEKVKSLREKATDYEDGVTKVLLLHHPIAGCRTSENYVCPAQDGLAPDAICDGWDLVAAGHFHDMQTFGAKNNGLYVGAPMQHDFRDANRTEERGVVIATFDGAVPKIKHVPIQSPRFYALRWSQITNHAFKASMLSRGDRVRVGVEATSTNWATEGAQAEMWAKPLREQGVHVSVFHIPIIEAQQRLEVGDRLSTDQVLLDYVNSVDTGGLDKTRLLEIGRALLKEAQNG
jgi:DNA repair exonuclease SbcCD nuclease subunit